MSNDNQIANYQYFVDFLRDGLKNLSVNPLSDFKEIALRSVNGLAEEELRRLVDIDTRRKYGAFFTNSELAKSFLYHLKPRFDKRSVIYDPACGAGNLLLATDILINQLNLQIENREYLYGTDTHQEFVDATKLRLQINQFIIANENSLGIKLKSNFSILREDGLLGNEFYEQATHILVNPPFNLISVDEKLEWSSGKVSAAAVFIDKIIQYINPGVPVYAILPDVLRNGSRYDRWRNLITKKCVIGKTELLGQFDKYADIDVFAIQLTKRKKAVYFSVDEEKKVEKVENIKTIGDIFEVCVGTVVDNRDPHSGPRLNYIVSKGLKGWTTLSTATLFRKHGGKSFKNPFVVIKRTSRRGDASRAIGTIINFNKEVYVDNHLIVLKPISGKLKDCKSILINLKDKKTDSWLDEKLRCRHLTVKMVKQIPIWKLNS